MNEIKTVIWDFNGTLIDDAEAGILAVNDMLTKRSQKPIDKVQYAAAVDTPIWKFYEKVFVKGSITPEEAMVEFDTGYEKYLSENPLMEGALEMLRYFKEKDINQLVVSASHIDKVSARLKELNLYHYFDRVLAHSDYKAGDKTYLAKEYLKEKCISPENVVVIGDCVFDYNMAEGIGASCILTTKGHQTRRELSQTKALIVDSLTEIKNIV